MTLPRTKNLADRGIPADQLFRHLVSNVHDYAIFMLDPDGRVASWNAGATRIKGYEPSEIIGTHFSCFYPEADVRAGKCERELAIAAEVGRFEDEGWRVRKDGSRLWANVIISAVRDDDGTLLGFAKVTRDLTERKRAEDERLAAEERFRLFVESVQDYAMLILDPTGIITTWNAGAQRIKGWAANEIVGKHFSAFYPVEDVRAGKCEMELDVAAREGRFEDENWRVRKDGARFWANVVITALRDGRGELIGFAKVTRDLTASKRAEEERAARLAAEHAARVKDDFLALLGHELRNPLAPIVTALSLMDLGEQHAARARAVIERQIGHMMVLVDDLLDVSRIGRGKLSLQSEEVDLRSAIATAIEAASPLVDQRGQRLTVQLPDTPVTLVGDEARLVQVFTNLLRNAAKFTQPDGRIAVRLAVRGDRATVDVEDNGIGIAADLLPHVFELFVQGHQSSERATGGLGIGLTLVRSIIELHHGKVGARSGGVGRGSTFTVELPTSRPHHERDGSGDDAVPAKTHAPRRLLLVDDNDDARDMLHELLACAGHDVASVADGASALAAARDAAPDVAILDIGLPGMDGYELARRLHDESPSTRLVSLTGYGQPGDVVRGREAGFERHFVKPVSIRKLLAVIDDL